MKQVLICSIILGLAIAGLKAIEYRFLVIDHSLELYGGIVAMLFTAVGVWGGWTLTRPRGDRVPVATTGFQLNEKNLTKLNISQREMEVLELIALGLSNQEIADRLFVSVNTIKSHSSNLFVKLDVKRRTGAIRKARTMGLIP